MMVGKQQRREHPITPAPDGELAEATFVQAVVLYDLCTKHAKASDSDADAAPARSQRRVRRFESAPVG
jgi:hypothetical protein